MQVEALVKSFPGGRRVIDGLDLTVAAGEAVALIGANGTGKSTLLRMAVRLVEPDSGAIRLFGEDVCAARGRTLSRLRSRVGFVFQKHNLVTRLSALSNVVHGVQARRSGPRTWHQAWARRVDREEAMACLEAVGLADRAMQTVGSLSGGQSQRVAIARMLMQRPELVLADEPDASLDPRAGEEIMGLLARLARDKGLGLVFVSHHMEHAVGFSDRVVGLAGGRVALDRPAAGTDPALLEAFFDGPQATERVVPLRRVAMGAAS
nr:ATP-binding cassette domain-containing protein [Chthonobacter albigriseus]